MWAWERHVWEVQGAAIRGARVSVWVWKCSDVENILKFHCSMHTKQISKYFQWLPWYQQNLDKNFLICSTTLQVVCTTRTERHANKRVFANHFDGLIRRRGREGHTLVPVWIEWSLHNTTLEHGVMAVLHNHIGVTEPWVERSKVKGQRWKVKGHTHWFCWRAYHLSL